MITQELLHELFTYIEGHLYWKKSQGCKRKGDIAGCKGAGCYWIVAVNKHRYLNHRLIFLFHKGYLPKFVDHRKDRSNDRIENLRGCTRNQNNHNRAINRNSTTGIKGVIWVKSSKRWRVVIGLNSVKYFIGNFKDLKEAEREHL